MPLTDTSYRIIQSSSSGDFKTEWQDCLGQLAMLKKNDSLRIFKLNVFLRSTHFADFKTKKRVVEETILNAFGEECPAFGILSSSPEEPSIVAIEAGLVNSSELNITFRKYRKWCYTVLEKNGHKELWASGLGRSGSLIRTRSASIKAFEIMRQILLAENMTFNNIVRQWNYIGRILFPGEKNLLISQHYSVFNNVRFKYYSRYRNGSDFPAATGIGMKYNGVLIDFCAVAPASDEQINSVKNPRQINPCNYDEKVLAATAIQGHKGKQFPLFDRAKLLISQDKSLLFVSGTAAIVGQETLGKGDVKKQTIITIENIESLTGKENIVKHSKKPDLRIPDKYKFIRVYVKNASDIPVVKSICTDYYGNIPAIYVESDICRADLLVEIETELNS